VTLIPAKPPAALPHAVPHHPVPHQANGLQIPRPELPRPELPRPEPRRAPWLAVAGSKGGVGKTMLATNLALLLRRAGHRTLLVDLDPGCGNVGVHLRLSSRYDVEHVAAGECSVAEAIVEGPDQLAVLLGRSGSTALAQADERLSDALLTKIAAAARDFDVVVVDTGAGLGALTLAAVQRADLTLGIATPDLSALTDAYALCKVLHRRGRPLPHLVVNRVQNRDEAMRTASRLAGVTRKFLGLDCVLAGWIAQDPLVELSVRDQRPLCLYGQGAGLEDLRSVCAAALAALPAMNRRPAATLAPAPRHVRLRPAAR
jgi:flagellar biosynthesis protein FlhG